MNATVSGMITLHPPNIQVCGLPDEIWLHHILPFLPQKDLLTTALLSKKMNSLSRNTTLWHEVELFASPDTRSMDHFMFLMSMFKNVTTLKVSVTRPYIGDICYDPIDENEDLKNAIKNLLLTKPSVTRSELSFQNLGLQNPREDLRPIFEVFEEYGTYIDQVKMIENGLKSYVRWYNWIEEFIDVAPTLCSHLRVLELCDIELHPYPVDPNAVPNIIKGCQQLEELRIESKVLMRARELRNMLEEMENSRMLKFHYKTEKNMELWGMRHWNDSDLEWNSLDSKSYNIYFQKNVNGNIVMMSAVKK